MTGTPASDGDARPLPCVGGAAGASYGGHRHPPFSAMGWPGAPPTCPRPGAPPVATSTPPGPVAPQHSHSPQWAPQCPQAWGRKTLGRGTRGREWSSPPPQCLGARNGGPATPPLCKYRDFYINLIKGLYKQPPCQGTEVGRGHRAPWHGHHYCPRAVPAPSVASLRYSGCGISPGRAPARRRAVMTSVPASVRAQLTDSGSVSSGSRHWWVKVSHTVPSSATCMAQWHKMVTRGERAAGCFPVSPVQVTVFREGGGDPHLLSPDGNVAVGGGHHDVGGIELADVGHHLVGVTLHPHPCAQGVGAHGARGTCRDQE